MKQDSGPSRSLRHAKQCPAAHYADLNGGNTLCDVKFGEDDETHYVTTAWYHVTLACRSSDQGVEQGKRQRVWRLFNN